MLYRLYNEMPRSEIQAAINDVVNHARTEWAPLPFEGEFPMRGFGIANLRPKDLYATTTGMQSSVYWACSQNAASGYSSFVNMTISDMAYVLITGVMSLDANPTITMMQPDANGVTLPVMDFEEMYSWDLARAWLSAPFSVKPEGNLTIDTIGTSIVQKEKFGLLGKTVAKRTYLISQ